MLDPAHATFDTTLTMTMRLFEDSYLHLLLHHCSQKPKEYII